MAHTPGLNIFLVDDDVMCLNLYKQFLKQAGYVNIELFDSGMDCIDALVEDEPDLIFLDYNMEGMNGLDVLKKIKETDPQILVMFISGQEDIQIAVNAIKHGAVDYIVKSSLNPDKMKAVMEKIENIRPARDRKPKKSFLKKLFS